jgi:hypothetical protein
MLMERRDCHLAVAVAGRWEDDERGYQEDI